MLALRLWIQSQTQESSTFEFFLSCYQKTHGTPCRSNQVFLDTNHYGRPPFPIPDYVQSVFERR